MKNSNLSTHLLKNHFILLNFILLVSFSFVSTASAQRGSGSKTTGPTPTVNDTDITIILHGRCNNGLPQLGQGWNWGERRAMG